MESTNMAEMLKLTIKMTKNKTLRTPIKKEKKKLRTPIKEKQNLRTKMKIYNIDFGSKIRKKNSQS